MKTRVNGLWSLALSAVLVFALGTVAFATNDDPPELGPESTVAETVATPDGQPTGTTFDATPIPEEDPDPEPVDDVPSPEPIVGWIEEDGAYYFVNSDGTRATGWIDHGGSRYLLGPTGAMRTGWVKQGATWYLLSSSGAMATGWAKDGASWYLLDSNGAMRTGWVKQGSTWYLLKSSGAMATGWAKDKSSWYYLKSSGAMATGWAKDGSSWYLLNSSGVMRTGWVKQGSTWYLLKSSGAMATGWAKDKGSWYYLKSSGAMATGWVKASGSWYYLNSNGVWAVDVLVNKKNPLSPKRYVPPLVTLTSVGVAGGQSMHPEAADAMARMAAAARSRGTPIEVLSGYRSYDTQAYLFANYSARSGVAVAESYSARAGYSEHQTGLAADLSVPGGACYLKGCFGSSSAGKWVAQNGWKYGFIIRYPEGYTSTTGYIYEPWHVRYVGVGIATDMRNRGIATYEQYLGVPAAPRY